MLPATQIRKPRNSAKINLMISVVFHGLIMVALLYFAAREGYLGKQLKKIAIEMVKEKPAEKPKEPEKPKEEIPKVEPPKVAVTPRLAPPATTPNTPPPSGAVAPAAAPAAAEVPSFQFGGGVAVESDPLQVYKQQVEYALRSRWNRPDDVDDSSYVAEVEVAVDKAGKISDPTWKKSSGDTRWDNSVRAAIAATVAVGHVPPKNFPPRFLVRFDVQIEPVFQ